MTARYNRPAIERLGLERKHYAGWAPYGVIAGGLLALGLLFWLLAVMAGAPVWVWGVIVACVGLGAVMLIAKTVIKRLRRH